MKKELLTELINRLLSTGGTFGELFIEDKTNKILTYLDNKLDSVDVTHINGMGIRLAFNNDIYFASTNDLNKKNLLSIIDQLASNINEKSIFNNIILSKLHSYKHKILISHDELTDIKKREFMKKLNNDIRLRDKRICQVRITLFEGNDDITIVNHTGLYKKERRIHTRLVIVLTLKDQEASSTSVYTLGSSNGYELINMDLNNAIDDLVKEGIDNLYAKPCVGKEMPVVIANGFGAIIFHEACGHAMEATSVADNLSVLSGKLNTKIANEKVTIIDDATLDNEWGSTFMDDEGAETRKNTLIKDGVLVNYYVDELNSHKMKHASNGCSRRESYKYAPTSRMNNTYLAPGNDSIDDMIKSIDLGLFAKKMKGGSVSTETGDFNFAVDSAYMIRNGKIAECVKSASLIGNTLSILNNVEMVSDDLKFKTGMCGSKSGHVKVTVGQPTIKVSKILVGGVQDEQ